jgi:hypothetical protein
MVVNRFGGFKTLENYDHLAQNVVISAYGIVITYSL